jgi:predicted enzyme related to lactoylglutathione lyase
VRDLKALVRHLKKIGVKVDPIEPGDDGDGMGWFTHTTDPDGNRLELWEPSGGV